MTPTQAQSLKRDFVVMAAYYGQAIDDAVLLMYVDDLGDLPYDAVRAAMQTLRRQPRRTRCPLPGDIRDLVTPSEGSDAARANDIAGRICQAISHDGRTNMARARTRVGEVGWLVVQRLGGWAALCQSVNVADMNTFRAQARDQARAQLEMQARSPLGAPQLPAHAQARRLDAPRGRPFESLAEVLDAMPAHVRAACPVGAPARK